MIVPIFATRIRRGFTVVELLIVIVAIAILATITLVGYNGIQQRAKKTALTSSLRQASDAALAYNVQNGSYPSSLSDMNIASEGKINYAYSSDSDSFCVTAVYDGSTSYHTDQTGNIQDGPCDGQPGGSDYCPELSFVAVNGYYCDGSNGGLASLNTAVRKYSGSDSGVPANAPATYVGRQSDRDNIIGSSFNIKPGDRYCLGMWAANATSTVEHGIGLQVKNNDGSTAWQIAGKSNAAASTGWTKVTGCITIGGSGKTASVWTQNNGSPGGTASGYWYQTGVTITKS